MCCLTHEHTRVSLVDPVILLNLIFQIMAYDSFNGGDLESERLR